MHSCLYRGHVRHRRGEPAHQFTYSTSWAYLDLDEISTIEKSCRWLSDRKFGWASFRRDDHFGDPSKSMKDEVLGLVHQQTDSSEIQSVRVLTQLRHLGFYFSPVNVFYCFREDESLAAMVAEVSNTPWRERHCYVLWSGNRVAGSRSRYVHPKEFHVSPFMDMQSTYHWRADSPEEKLHLSIGCCREQRRIFHADMHLKRVPLTGSQMLRSLARRPVAGAHVLGAIYFEALRLWMKKCQFYPHPQKQPTTRATVRKSGDTADTVTSH